MHWGCIECYSAIFQTTKLTFMRGGYFAIYQICQNRVNFMCRLAIIPGTYMHTGRLEYICRVFAITHSVKRAKRDRMHVDPCGKAAGPRRKRSKRSRSIIYYNCRRSQSEKLLIYAGDSWAIREGSLSKARFERNVPLWESRFLPMMRVDITSSYLRRPAAFDHVNHISK